MYALTVHEVAMERGRRARLKYIYAAMIMVIGSMSCAMEVSVTEQHILRSNRDWNDIPSDSLMMSEYHRNKGLAYYGNNERLRLKLSQLKRGANITVAAIGGSITAGQNVMDGFSDIWVYRFIKLLNATRQEGHGHVNVANGAVAGTVSMYMSVCVKSHVPENADVVLVEYAVNDPWNAPVDSDVRRAFERLLRKLLQFPSRPAVVLVNSFMYLPNKNSYWVTTERDFLDMASYYGVPSVSLRACCYQLLEANAPGFWTNTTREERQHAALPLLRGRLFYYDSVHPDGNTGHRVLAELTYGLFQRTYQDLLVRPATSEDARLASEALPPPMHRDNYESRDDRCLLGNRFQDSVVEKQGFEWVNESPATRRPKWGFVATQPGARILMKVNSMAASGDKSAEVLVELAHLKSYEHMGRASLTCERGCTCQPQLMEAHHEEKHSQTYLQHVYVSQAPECVVAATVLNETSSGEHKFKVIAIMVSEVAGVQRGIQNSGAVEYVHDIASRSTDEKRFDVINHA